MTGGLVTALLLLAWAPLAHAPPSQPLAGAAPPSSSSSSSPSGVPPSPSPHMGPGAPRNPNDYDEQLGTTFTQNFTSIQYNVTAVSQVDPILDTGPGYLLNGLTTAGYWYQVGVSYNWSPGESPGTGFDMNYEAWDALGNSIYPTTGGGLLAFSATVNNGDVILLGLSFTGGNVAMKATDTKTGATAQTTYGAQGATTFVGLPGQVSNSNGYFTGLMTEWYHGQPYYANPAETIYTNPHLNLTSGWLWMDEFNSNTQVNIFDSSTTSAVSFNPPNTLQEFSLGQVTEYADAHEFVTGPLSGTTTTTTSSGSPSVSTTTVTVTQVSTTPVTTTQTLTQTSTSTVTQDVPTIPSWAYAVMALLLLAGLMGGYLVRGSSRGAAPPPAAPPAMAVRGRRSLSSLSRPLRI